MPEYSRKIGETFLEGLAAVPEKKCKGQQRDGDDDQPRPFESLGDSRTHGSNRAGRGFEVRVGNPVRCENPVKRRAPSGDSQRGERKGSSGPRLAREE